MTGTICYLCVRVGPKVNGGVSVTTDQQSFHKIWGHWRPWYIVDIYEHSLLSRLSLGAVFKAAYLDEAISIGQIAERHKVSKGYVKRVLAKEGLSEFEKHRPTYFHGTLPFGWKLFKGKLIPHQKQQAVIAQMKRMREQGNSLRSIARYLNLQKIKRISGKSWHPQSVDRALKINEKIEKSKK